MTLLETAYSDYAHGERSPLVIASTVGTFDEDLSYYFTGYRQFFTIEKRLLRYVRGTILDCGAGPGRISGYLQKKKYTVIPVDSSNVMRQIATERGVHSYILADAFDLPHTLRADTVVLMGNTVGICHSTDDIVRLFRSCAKVLSPNGRILLTATDPHAYKLSASTHIEGTLRYKSMTEAFSWFIASRHDIEDAATTARLRLDYIDTCDGVAGFVFIKS